VQRHHLAGINPRRPEAVRLNGGGAGVGCYNRGTPPAARGKLINKAKSVPGTVEREAAAREDIAADQCLKRKVAQRQLQDTDAPKRQIIAALAGRMNERHARG